MSATKTHVIKITGVPDELLRLLDDRVNAQHYGGRAEYLRELMRRDLFGWNPRTHLAAVAPKTTEEVAAAFAHIEARDMSHVQPLAEGADSRGAIYGNDPSVANAPRLKTVIPEGGARSSADVHAVVARAIALGPTPSLEPGADSREAIYGDRA
jgi:Arc/MetJ-type ribon-helix-helix transcriptional regulator